MHRRELLRSALSAGAAVVAAPAVLRGRFRLLASTESEYSTRALDLVGQSTVIDMLGLLTLDWTQLRTWHNTPESFSAGDFELVQRSGIDVFHPAVDLNSANPYRSTVTLLSSWNQFIASQTDRFVRVDTPGALREARSSGRVGILLGMQNSGHFRTLADIHLFHSMGQRICQLTYNDSNRIGYGCTERQDRGLTEFGATVVEEMNRQGMAIDVSHAGEQTCFDAFAVSKRPALITHSNCKALAPHPRCVSDEVIKRMAKIGGVIGLTALGPFVRRSAQATLEDALDHFDHVAQLVGVEHIGIGSDTDLLGRDRFRRTGQRMDIAGLNHPRRVFDLTEGLIRRGYSNDAIGMILGGNFVRALDAAMLPA